MKERLKRLGSSVLRILGKPWVWAPLVFLAAGSTGFAVGAWQNLCADCPSIAQIHTWEPQETSKVYSHDGRLIAELGVQRRTAVPIADLPPHVPQAFVAIEDGRFYEHSGVDPLSVVRAVVSRVVPRSLIRAVTGVSLRTGGASTITQQLARNMFVERIGFEVSLERKLKEMQVALEIERAYTKDQILEAYMNQINFDRGWYGVQTAARNYFGKDAVQMNPAEAAMLAAVVNSPGNYNPIRNPESGLQRRNLVLDRMAAEGFLTEAEAERWKEFPIPTERANVSEGSAPYFVEWVRRQAEQRFGSQLYTAGFSIYTTLDVDMQRAAELAMDAGFDRIEANPSFSFPRYEEFADRTEPFPTADSPYVQGAFVAMDPLTGGVRAMVGGRDFNHSKFNRVTQALRQPGSSFKTFVYASALARGLPPSHIINDVPYEWENPATGEIWRPRNFENTFNGEITMREGYRRSINTVAAWVQDEIGLETIAQTAESWGIRTPIPRVPSIAIGAAEVIPLQMTEAYSVMATLGTRVQPIGITRVVDSEGTVLWEQESTRTQVFDPQVARLMVTMMEDVVNAAVGGTGAAVRQFVPNLPAAGKTGTTNESTDLWFVGFTPNLMATVWFGMDQPQPVHATATSGEATRVWGRFMQEVYYGNAFLDLIPEGGGGEYDQGIGDEPRPLLPIPQRWPLMGLSQVSVDRETGLRASQWCPRDRAYLEYFLPGTEPDEFCDETVGRGRRGSQFGI